MHACNYLRLQREFLLPLRDFFFSQETSEDFSGIFYIFLEDVARNPGHVLQTWIKRKTCRYRRNNILKRDNLTKENVLIKLYFW